MPLSRRRLIVIDEPRQGDLVLRLHICDGYTQFEALIPGRCYIDYFSPESNQIISESDADIEYFPLANWETGLQPHPPQAHIH